MELATKMSLSFNATSLRESIGHLQEASAVLDEEKANAEERLRRSLQEIPYQRFRALQHLVHRIGTVLGFEASRDNEVAYAEISRMSPESLWDYLVDVGASPPHRLPPPIHKLVKAAKRVQSANKKLATFERGFISEGGIKDREWFKHLGIAPGKWLGLYHGC